MTVKTVVRALPEVAATWSATSRTETGWRSATYRNTCISSRPIISRLRAIDESPRRTI